ncbi:group II intron maturase-specific domain-containing protein [Inediibacterium massiliense]|uniref:group II intron maturase-specific domain-containing protein n=1 Tax=Inediibacterium massiliense TaxID=1658111 RepID=UPI00241DEC0E|nr:group II intron maturase-specific domain-containing protein [Inediibacterium massiliense]
MKRFKDKVRKITSRNYSISMKEKIRRLNQVIIGWVNYLSLAKAIMKSLEGWIRKRLRMCIWRQWKNQKLRLKIAYL